MSNKLAGSKQESRAPKIIHYCWFGGNALSDSARSAMATWEKFAPGFEVKRWDETNFDISACSFTKKAYEARKWAYVSDYARLRILYENGGVYMDVGSTLVKDVTPLLQYSPFSAIENGRKTVNTGLIASCEAFNPVVAEVLAAYEELAFEDNYSFLYAHTANLMFTRVLEQHGFVCEDRLQRVAGWTLLPCDYFDPLLRKGGYSITHNTYSTHMSSSSWTPKSEQMRARLIKKMAPHTGDWIARKIARIASEAAKATVFRDE